MWNLLFSDVPRLNAVAAPAFDCTGKQDGNYVIPDVFQYVECKSNVATVRSCPANQIFIANTKTCGAVVIGDEGETIKLT